MIILIAILGLLYLYPGSIVSGLAKRRGWHEPTHYDTYRGRTVKVNFNTWSGILVVFWPFYLIGRGIWNLFRTAIVGKIAMGFGTGILYLAIAIFSPILGLVWVYNTAANGNPWQRWKTYVLRKSS